MAIDPAVLARQQVVVTRRPKPKPRLRIVGGRRQTCDCGRCSRCKNREWMREYRARTGRRDDANTLDLVRSCAVCRGDILGRNDTGVCTRCQQRHIRGPVAAWLWTHGFVTPGGGI